MKNILFLISVILCCSSCSKELFKVAPKDQKAIYDEFWTYVDENYIYFKEKEVDWQTVYDTYSPTINEFSTDEALLQAMENSLLQLRDNHNIVKTPFRNGKSYNYMDGYEIHFSKDLVENNYLQDKLQQDNVFEYGYIDEQTLYIYIPKMKNFYYLQKLLRTLITPQIKNLILDTRNNGGGNSNPVPIMLGDFVKEKTYLGGYIEKTGPGHEDETAPLAVYANPSVSVYHDVQVYLLINRMGYSATSYLAAMCKGLPNFTLVGQLTGGGGGGNAGFELSNGWSVAVSVSDFVDKEGRSIELGVEPNIAIENSEEDINNGKDRMLEKVLEQLR